MFSFENQIEWIKWLHTFRTPAVDEIFKALNYLDSFYFQMLLLPTILYGYSPRIGRRMLYIIFLGSFLNSYLKTFFGLPRPCHLDETINLLYLSSNGFPSGAAQSAFLYIAITFWETNQLSLRFAAVLLAFVISFSRIFLGVHFLTDLFGGYFFGACIFSIYIFIFSYLENILPKITKSLRFLLILALIFLLTIIQIERSEIFLIMLFGALLGDNWRKGQATPTHLRGILATAIIFATYAGTKMLFSHLPNAPEQIKLFAPFFITGITLTFGINMLFQTRSSITR